MKVGLFAVASLEKIIVIIIHEFFSNCFIVESKIIVRNCKFLKVTILKMQKNCHTSKAVIYPGLEVEGEIKDGGYNFPKNFEIFKNLN